jgi:hypothetical protein
MVGHFFRYLSGRGKSIWSLNGLGKRGTKARSGAGNGSERNIRGWTLGADYIPFSSQIGEGRHGGNTVPGIALDLESAAPTVREGTDYSETQEYGFDPALILESIISAYAIRSAGYAIEESGTIKTKTDCSRSRWRRPPSILPIWNKIQARMKELELARLDMIARTGGRDE